MNIRNTLFLACVSLLIRSMIISFGRVLNQPESSQRCVDIATKFSLEDATLNEVRVIVAQAGIILGFVIQFISVIINDYTTGGFWEVMSVALIDVTFYSGSCCIFFTSDEVDDKTTQMLLALDLNTAPVIDVPLSRKSDIFALFEGRAHIPKPTSGKYPLAGGSWAH
ncbi:hypothetical protein PVAG01_07449 [Phlyctema vagabunda]|uniref:Uncharacterized protein n=1 Tax=Phlyctema vagabunda TaxID=108571 RepID=A0ABR4PCK7_9HELO